MDRVQQICAELVQLYRAQLEIWELGKLGNVNEADAAWDESLKVTAPFFVFHSKLPLSVGIATKVIGGVQWPT